MAINKKLIHFNYLATFESELAKGNILDTSIVFIKDAKLIWTHGNYYTLDYIKEAPEDGKIYGRKNGQWVEASSVESLFEVCKITIDSNLIDFDNSKVIITVDLNGIQKTYKYDGSPLIVEIPLLVNYTVSVNTIDGYAISNPSRSFVAVPGELREVKFTYNGTKLTVSRSFNKAATKANGSATINYGTGTKTINYSTLDSDTVLIPTGSTVNITYSDIAKCKTPTITLFVATGAALSKDGLYLSTLITVNRTSNSTLPTVDSTVTVNYLGVDQETKTFVNNSTSFYIPTDAVYTLTASDITGYKTPDVYSSTAGSDTTVELQYKLSTITISIITNQVSHADVANATATYNGIAYTNGLSLTVPFGASCLFVFSAVPGYRTPGTLTITANQESITVSGSYDTLLLTVNVTGGITSGFTISIANVGTQTATSQTHKVPYDVSYSISGNVVTGWEAPTYPNGTSGVANSVSATYSVNYKKITKPTTAGVWILTVDNLYITADTWANLGTPNGIFIKNDLHEFVLALTENSTRKYWKTSNADTAGPVEIKDINQAKADYSSGINNRPYLSDSAHPAGLYAYSYIFPNGKLGYLPSAGELWMAYLNKAAVNAALAKVGTNMYTDGYSYWSATEYGEYSNGNWSAWGLYWYNGNFNDNSVYNSQRHVRSACSS